MKRIGNLYERIYSIQNLWLADEIARKGKSKQPGIIEHDKNKEENLLQLQLSLMDGTYKTSPYTIFKIYEPKEREIYRLPFIDRIAQHAIMNVSESIFVATFTADTYSCIKGRGIHKALKSLKKALRDVDNTTYCLKLDIKKFYPSVDNDILKQLLRRKFKDKEYLSLIDGIIDSTQGLPIGNYLSQYLANFYLSYFDHWLKEEMGVRYYFRYADDLVILSPSKPYLHALLAKIRTYLKEKLKLSVKGNYQIFPVKDRGIDFVGYPTFHDHVRIRKRIKKSFARVVARRNKSMHPERFRSSIASYKGWAKHADCKHLLKKLLNENV